MRSSINLNRGVLASICCFALLAFLSLLPAFFKTSAGNNRSHDSESKAARFGDYDIRTDKAASEKVAEFRGHASKNAVDVANLRGSFAHGEKKLRGKISSLKVEYNDDLRIPEVIGPDVRGGKEFLNAPTTEKRSEVLKRFLTDNDQLTGVSVEHVAKLKLASDYKNPEDDLAMAEYEQELNGIPVFRGSVKAGFTKRNQIVRVINNLAPGLDETEVSTDFGDPAQALVAAASLIDHKISGSEASFSETAPSKYAFGGSDFAPTAEKIYFPTEPGVAVPAWRVLIWEPVEAYYIIVDAQSGTMLWRKKITDDQTQQATFNVYTNPNAMVNVADNPFPMTPGPTTPNGVQGGPLARTLIARVGNEAPYTFNNLGWITDGGNTTDGNNVQAGLDRDISNGVDATNGVAVGTSRVFDFPFNPGVPVASGTPAGDSPLITFNVDSTEVDVVTNQLTETAHGLPNNAVVRFTTTGTLPSPLAINTNYFIVNTSADNFSVSLTSGGAAVDITTQGTGTLNVRITPTPCVNASIPITNYQKAIVTQLFYITNWYHDETYRLGFTEAAGNFQNDNFSRGGSGLDRVSAEAQDCAGTNNANFGTPSDGGRGRMQMFLWTVPTPDFDGSIDADIVIHELTHGLSNRLHGNAGGLSGLNMSRGMGEGWSDFYAHAMLSEPTDPINGIYPTGGYATYKLNPFPNDLNNYYYGIRRFPKAVMAFTGPNGKPHNPMTFNDIDTTKINLNDGAFAPAFSTTADGTHAQGEVWSSALWEVRAKYIQRLGWAVGNRRVLQHVTDGMKLAPLSPTFLQERDAIAAAAIATGTAEDVADVWSGFAIRGMGWSASIQNTGGSTADGSGTSLTRVTEAFDGPNLILSPDITISDSTGDNDGVFEPGEPVQITVSLKNITGLTANNVNVQLVGGGAASYGTIAHSGIVSNQINFTIPAGTPCGSALNITINVNSSLGPTSFVRPIQIGSPSLTFSENFDGVTAPSFPAGWTAASVQSGINFVTSTSNSNSAPNAAFAADPTAVGGGSDLTTPSIPITTQAAILTFRNRYDTETGWDGGVVEISIAGGSFQDIITAGGAFIANGYNGPLGPGDNNPLANRPAWSGNSNGYLTTSIRLPAAAAGQNVQFRFRFGGDDNTAGVGPNPGWYIDNVQVFGQASCSFAGPARNAERADFDGDGKTDLSVWRPSEGNWYLAQSTAGLRLLGWGANGDKIQPADYDGDGKTDFGVYRPSNNVWYMIYSGDNTIHTAGWGFAGDIPVAGHYGGGFSDSPAVFRPSNGHWYILETFSEAAWGQNGDLPVPADYNGDGKTDLAVFRPSTGQWYLSVNNVNSVTVLGTAGDMPVPADYDGDGKDDLAIWRPSTGVWQILIGSTLVQQGWGVNGDVPVPGDYDGDGHYDIAIYRPTEGKWYLLRSTLSIAVANWGINGDIPAPVGYIPN